MLLVTVVFLAFTALLPGRAEAAVTSIFDGTVSCKQQSGQTRCGTGAFGANNGTRSTVKSFDGVPVDVNLILPKPADSPWADGPYPLVMGFHGWSQGKLPFSRMAELANRGYAVLSVTNRGFHETCGTDSSRLADPDCDHGWLRLDDSRFEIRDAQHLAGLLVDEGLVIPDRIAAQGSSYGGGMSLALAALRDRVMLPDGSYAPWQSPDGTPLELAVALPDITWSDLAYALFPNGSFLDYLADSPYRGPFGVMKHSLVNGLFLAGLMNARANYRPAGAEVEDGSLPLWKSVMERGEPYREDAIRLQRELSDFHSAYGIDHDQAPAPLLISAGFTDDLFPASEALRFYNRIRAEHPTADIGLFLGPIGGNLSHPRGQNKTGVKNAQQQLNFEWLGHYLGHPDGPASSPAGEVRTFTQTCPDSKAAAGPFVTADWVAQSPGEIRLEGADPQTVLPDGGDRDVAEAFRPGDGASPCEEAAGAVEPGTATWQLDPAPAGGFTVMGSPTVIADIEAPGGRSTLAARLVDVAPDGNTKRLIARALWRPAESGRQVFQLWPNGWKVEKDHSLRLELLPHEKGNAPSLTTGLFPNFSRPSNGQQPVTVSNLELRVPVREAPGALGGSVGTPEPRVTPGCDADALAPGNETIGADPLGPALGESGSPWCEPPQPMAGDDPDPDDGDNPGDSDPGDGDPDDPGGPYPLSGQIVIKGKPQVKNKVLIAKVRCVGDGNCARASVVFRGVPKGKRFKLAGRKLTALPGQARTVRFRLTRRARNFFRDRRKKVRRNGRVRVRTVKGPKQLRAQVRIAGKAAGRTVVRRTGPVR